MDDREHQLAERAEARRQETPPQRQPVWRQPSAPMTAEEERKLADRIDRTYRLGR